jgi:hypothetical protein
MAAKGIYDNVLSDFIYETAKDGLTATAGGGQAGALLISAQTSRITTVATAGDSIKLPVAAAGLELIVINHGANPMQVFGSGADQINDVAAATGVSHLQNSTVIYTCTSAGLWYTEGLATGFSAGYQTLSFANALTAFAGGGQASATVLTGMMNRVTTVATSGDSVKLPASAPGMDIVVINSGAAPMAVWGAGSDTVNGATSVTQMQNSVVVYTSTVAGLWFAEGIGGGFSGSFPTTSAVNGITAFAGGGQASAVLLTATINRVTTVATAADSVKMPVSAAGMQITVTNAAAANSMNLYPQTGDQINALGANAAFAVAAGKTANLTCAVAGQWHAVLSA